MVAPPAPVLGWEYDYPKRGIERVRHQIRLGGAGMHVDSIHPLRSGAAANGRISAGRRVELRIRTRFDLPVRNCELDDKRLEGVSV